MMRFPAKRLLCPLLATAMVAPVLAQQRPGERDAYGDRYQGRFGDPAGGYFGDPADGRFGSRFPAEPWMPVPPLDTGAVDSAPYVIIPYPSDPRRDRIDEPQDRNPGPIAGPADQ